MTNRPGADLHLPEGRRAGQACVRLLHYWRAMWGIIWRELWRFVTQRERFISALVRPLVWLFVFAAGFRAALGLAITPPYETYILYEVYITPGLIGMIQLFNGMQSSLSMVYDREMGSMRILMVCPLPRWFLLLSKLLAGTGVSVLQVYAFLAIAWFYDIQAPWQGYLWVLPALLLSGLMLGALGLLLSSFIKQLENFAGVMNFVIFPMFFMSTALYPLWKMKESSALLYHLAHYNPFSQAVELIRFALYGQFNSQAFIYTLVAFIVFMVAAIIGYNPSKGMMTRKGGA
jgi:ABC-2 type transport system permease protein